jgi:hypothetical protein
MSYAVNWLLVAVIISKQNSHPKRFIEIPGINASRFCIFKVYFPVLKAFVAP